MPTQAQEIDGHVLINDVEALGVGVSLSPGDLVEVEITEAMPQDIVGRAVRLISKFPNSKTAPSKMTVGLETRSANH